MIEKNLKIHDFVKHCMHNTYGDKENNEWYKKCLDEAKNTNQFFNLYFSTRDKKIICSQGYGELLKRETIFNEELDMYVSSVLSKGNNCYQTLSDRGDLKLGNDSFNIYVANGYGDGFTDVYLFEKDNEYIRAVENIMYYKTNIEGTFNIYQYDCGNKVLDVVTGNYDIYSFNGHIAFIERN